EINSYNAVYTGVPTLLVKDHTKRGTIILESAANYPTDFVFKNNGQGRVWLSSRNESDGYKFNIFTNPDGDESAEVCAMTIEQNGNVGIGTTSPSSDLTLKGTFEIRESDNENEAVKIIGGSTSSVFEGYNHGSQTIRIHSSTSQNTYFNAGNVGIGTIIPNAKLEVNSYNAVYTGVPSLLVKDHTNRGTIILESATDNPTDFVFKNNGQGRVWLSSRNESDGYKFNIFTNPDGVGSAEICAMTIEQNGNIGVGTSNPIAKLEVNSSGAVYSGTPSLLVKDNTNRGTIILESVTDNPTDLVFKNNGEARVWLSSRSSSDGHKFNIFTNPDGAGTAEMCAMTIEQNGNVGIGTTSPSSDLTLKGTFEIRESDNGNEAVKIIGGSTSSVFEGYNSGSQTVRIHSSTSQNTYFNAGNVGIGTTTPDQKLSVNGKIHSKEVIIDLDFPAPDYVFKKDYDLKSLAEVEAYINKNSHLPEIPSAKEFEENGVMVAEMNMNLLKKVEELTLYTIEQEKKINKLEKENEKLKSLSEQLIKIQERLDKIESEK
ncbi:MAG: hypothetical protein GY756_20820, partial [bacterium]|nr:hypothetical protein [bacterium]